MDIKDFKQASLEELTRSFIKGVTRVLVEKKRVDCFNTVVAMYNECEEDGTPKMEAYLMGPEDTSEKFFENLDRMIDDPNVYECNMMFSTDGTDGYDSIVIGAKPGTERIMFKHKVNTPFTDWVECKDNEVDLPSIIFEKGNYIN